MSDGKTQHARQAKQVLPCNLLSNCVSTLCTGGFRLVAALGFVAPLAVALVGPLVGQTLDGIPRSAGLRVSIIGQSCLIIAGGVSSLLLAVKSHQCLQHRWRIKHCAQRSWHKQIMFALSLRISFCAVCVVPGADFTHAHLARLFCNLYFAGWLRVFCKGEIFFAVGPD